MKTLRLKVQKVPKVADELAQKLEKALSNWMKASLSSEVELNSDMDPEITVTPDMLDRPADGHEAMKPTVGDYHKGGLGDNHGSCGEEKTIKINISSKKH